MICAYGPYSASATGGNGWARDFLAGVLTVPALPFFENVAKSTGRNLEIASTILFGISLVLVIGAFCIYRHGPALRKKSRFADRLARAGYEPDHAGGQKLQTMATRLGTFSDLTFSCAPPPWDPPFSNDWANLGRFFRYACGRPTSTACQIL